MQDESEQIFCSSFATWKQIFTKDIKLVAQENIQIMKTCCIIVVSIALTIKMYVLQTYLQTISSVLSCDGHLKPVCVCKFAHNYEHCDHSSLGCRFPYEIVSLEIAVLRR